jgi:hypothetical protein
MVKFDFPIGVEAEVVMLRVDVKSGFPDLGLNVAVAPVGRPDIERVTDSARP